jgi:hypothetical protein
MKTRIVVAFVAIAGILGLAGCKPKETALSGQVFIVAQGAENVKLGDVEILLIEKTQVINYLQTKQPVIESEMASKREELKQIQQGHVPDVLRTNAAYAKALSESDKLQKQFDVQLARMSQSTKDYSNNPERSDAVFSDAKAESKVIQIKMQAALDQMNAAQSAVAASLQNYPAPAHYFEGFSPVVAQKNLSDADGKFSFSYTQNKPLAIFASAQRMVLNKTEKYYWLIDAPIKSEKVQIFLSNNNLAFADPDGYFEVKPKPEIQESSDANTQ